MKFRKTSLKNKWILIIIFAFGISLATYFLYPKKTTDNSTNLKKYSGIEVYEKDNTELIGSVKISNKKILTDIKTEEISNFINSNKNSWERGTLSYPTGGIKNGIIWEGAIRTRISNDDHIVSIYVLLDDEFGSKYSIKLIKSGQ